MFFFVTNNKENIKQYITTYQSWEERNNIKEEVFLIHRRHRRHRHHRHHRHHRRLQ